MAVFLARVELHGGTESNYEILHSAMRDIGFARTVTRSDGVKFHLPSAEYTGFLDSNLTLIRVAVKNAANRTGRSSWVLVTQAAAIDWDLSVAR